MKRVNILPAVSAAFLLLTAVFVPRCLAESKSGGKLSVKDGTVYEFHDVIISSGKSFDRKTYKEQRFEYPANGPRMTATITGDTIVFRVPAYKNIPAMEFHGNLKVDDRNNRSAGYGPINRIIGDYSSLCGFITDDTNIRKNHYTLSHWDGPEGNFEFGSITLYHPDSKFFDITFKNRGMPGKGSRVVTTNAKVTAGEDGGTDVNPDGEDQNGDDSGTAGAVGGGLAVGIGAAAAAVVLKRRKKGEKGKKKKKTSYRMHIYKNFGDAIRAGADPVRVGARIAKVEDGVESDDAELTAGIVPTVTGLSLRSSGLKGRYMAADVSAEPGASGEGTVTFTIQTPSGTFVRKIVFRIVAETSIVFEEPDANGKTRHALPEGEGPTLEMVAGGKGRDSVYFHLADAAEEPVEVKADDVRDFKITFQKDPSAPFAYRALVANCSAPAVKEAGVFADAVKQTVTVRAKFKDGTEVTGLFDIGLYPDGLSVFIVPDDPQWRAHARLRRRSQGLPDILVDGRMEVVSFIKPRLNGIVDDEIAPLYFVPCFAYEKADGKATVVRQNKHFKARPFQPTDTTTRNLLAKYRGKAAPIGETAFCIQPKDILMEEDAPYLVNLPLSVSFGGRSASADIPVRLVGERLDPKMADWEKEYKELQRRITQFAVPENIGKWIALLKERATEPRCSVEELRIVSKTIVADYIDYWTRQRDADYAEIAHWENYLYGAEWVKLVGDSAFSFLINAFVGPVTDAILTPAKDLFFCTLGEFIAMDQHGMPLDWENLEIARSINSAGDNVAAHFTEKGIRANPKNLKMITAYIAGYYVIAVFRNYTIKRAQTGESDWYGAIKDAFKDLSVNAFKIIAGDLFQAWLKSESFQKKVGKMVQKYLNSQFHPRLKATCPTYDIRIDHKGITIAPLGQIKATLLKSTKRISISDAITKILGDIFGEGWGCLHEKIIGKLVEKPEIFVNEHGQVVFCFPIWERDGASPLYCELVLTKILAYQTNPFGFFAYLFEMLFGSLVGAPAITFPSDPPITRDKKQRLESLRQNQISSKYPDLFRHSSAPSASGGA